MYTNILQKLNFLIYLCIVVVAVVFQTTVFSYFPLNFIQPDILLIIAVYFGFQRGLIEGGLFIVLSSWIVEVHSGAGYSFYMTVYLYIFLISKILSRTVVSPDFFSSIGIVSALTLLKKIGVLILLGMHSRAENGLGNFLIYLIPGVMVEALLTAPLFGIFNSIDLKTHKDEHSEDEYDINKGFR